MVDEISKLIEELKTRRNSLLSTVIDPAMLNKERWENMSIEAKECFMNYRKYLLDITDNFCDDNFNKIKILSFEEWKNKQE